MAKKKKKRHRIDDPQWQSEERLLQEHRTKGPYLKMIVRQRGCILPFYDMIDSYTQEFRKIVDWAKAEYPSLLNVLEVDDNVFARPQDHWDELDCSGLKQVFFGDNTLSDYEAGVNSARFAALMAALHDSEGRLRTLILVRKSVRRAYRHSELNYIHKIESLCHEIGHVHDAERTINLKVGPDAVDLIEAEVFANLFAVDLMAKRRLYNSLKAFIENFREGATRSNTFGEISRAVINRMPTNAIPRWQDYICEQLSPHEKRLLGPKGVAVLTPGR